MLVQFHAARRCNYESSTVQTKLLPTELSSELKHYKSILAIPPFITCEQVVGRAILVVSCTLVSVAGFLFLPPFSRLLLYSLL